MGYCRRCGDLLFNDRCKCGGARRESTTKGLFNDNANEDKWTKRYTASSRINKPSSSTTIATTSTNDSSNTNTPTTLKPLNRRQQSNVTEDGELSGVFGSLLSPKDQWNCITCHRKFKQEETIYPHPEAKIDSEFSSVFFCRACFAESFSKGNCKKCKCAVLTDAPFIKHGDLLWHNECFNCSYCSVPTDPSSIVMDLANSPSCESCFNSLAYLKNLNQPSSPILSRPTTLRPAPSKWGSPVTPPPLPRDSSQNRNLNPNRSGGITPVQSGEMTDGGEKAVGWRARRERDKCPMVASFDELGAKLRELENLRIVPLNVGGGKNLKVEEREREREKEKMERPLIVKRSTSTTPSTSPIDTSTTSLREKKVEEKVQMVEVPRTILGVNNFTSNYTSSAPPPSSSSSIQTRTRTQSDITGGSRIAERAARLLSSSSSNLNSSTSPTKSQFGTPKAIKRQTWTTPSIVPNTKLSSTKDIDVIKVQEKEIKLTSSSPLYPQSITTPATAGKHCTSTQRERLNSFTSTPFYTPSIKTTADQPAWFTPKLRPAHARTQSLPPSPIFVQEVKVVPSSTSTSGSIFKSGSSGDNQKMSSRPTSPSKSTSTSRPASPLKTHWTLEDLEKEKSSETTTSSSSRSNSPFKRRPLPNIPPTPYNTPTNCGSNSITLSSTPSNTNTPVTYTTPSWLKPRLPHSRSQSLPPPMIQLPPGAPKVRGSISSTSTGTGIDRKEEEIVVEMVRTPSLVEKNSLGSIRPNSIHVAHKPIITSVPRSPSPAPIPATTLSTSVSAVSQIQPNKKAEVEEETCPVCNLDLGYGEFVQLAHTKAIIHRNCFRCEGCKEILEAGSHIEMEGKPWHEVCKSVKMVRTLVPLVLGGEEEGIFKKEGGEEKCEGCNESLDSKEYSISVGRTGKSYHQDCFTCGKCKKRFAGNGEERSFIDVEGIPYHSICAPATPLVNQQSRSLNPSPFRSSTSRSPASSPIPRPAKIDIPTSSSHSSSTTLTSSPSSIFASTRGPPKNLGGLIICAGCSARGTEKETVVGPLGRRYHPKCLRCRECSRGLDSECRVGVDGELRCEGCRRFAHK